MMYRIYHEPRLGEPMGYIVQQKHWYQFHWLSVAWFKTYEEAKEFLENYKYNHTNFPSKEWLYLWERIKISIEIFNK